MKEAKEEKLNEAVEIVKDAITVTRIFHKYHMDTYKVDTVLDAGYEGLKELKPTELDQIVLFKERITQLTVLRGLLYGANHTLKAMDKIMLKYKMDKIMEPQ